MHGITLFDHVESYLASFLPWYEEFLAKIQPYGIEQPGTDAFEIRHPLKEQESELLFVEDETQNKHPQPHVSVLGSRGAYKPLLDAQKTLEEKLYWSQQKENQNTVAVMPHFFDIQSSVIGLDGTTQNIPQYDLFVESIMLRTSKTAHVDIEIYHAHPTYPDTRILPIVPAYKLHPFISIESTPELIVPRESVEPSRIGTGSVSLHPEKNPLYGIFLPNGDNDGKNGLKFIIDAPEEKESNGKNVPDEYVVKCLHVPKDSIGEMHLTKFFELFSRNERAMNSATNR